ncbi:Roadblock-related dynein light chain [Giardia muris]|uniref:Dynein light chain roadblock n=1 Tax=Giardia muris TaxID=5742 RepID=A0A4Z1SND0_GIAMU|nr:Roadblock-related dynein light chain [Giardia muris]|eukprot:TNJ27246.1 Roadblock-related dynein light chain [Giardia muris]
MASELDETIKRISTRRGVEGIVIINSDGIPIRTSLDEEQATIYAGICSQLVMKGRALINAIDPSDELRLLRFRSRKYELLLAPDKGYVMIVIQNPQVE